MKTIHPIRYKCDHCTKSFSRKPSAESHELHCWKNPFRTPFLGELTSVKWTGEIVNYGRGPFGDNGPDGMDCNGWPLDEVTPRWRVCELDRLQPWRSPVEPETFHPWELGPGYWLSPEARVTLEEIRIPF